MNTNTHTGICTHVFTMAKKVEATPRSMDEKTDKQNRGHPHMGYHSAVKGMKALTCYNAAGELREHHAE